MFTNVYKIPMIMLAHLTTFALANKLIATISAAGIINAPKIANVA
jgi:hypothetical protein